MRLRRPLLVLLAAGLVAGSVPAFGAPAPAAARVDEVAPGVVRGDLGAASGDPRAVASAALRRWAPSLGVDAAAFRFESVRRSIVGVHVRGREFRGGVPVHGSAAAVHLVGGRVWQVDAIASPLAGSAAPTAISEDAARRLALAAAGLGSAFRVSSERVLFPAGGHLADTWHVTVFAMAPAYAGTVVLDAATGRALGVRDDRQFEDGTAKVFDPNPIVTHRDASLRQPAETGLSADADVDSAPLTAARRTLPLKDLDSTALAGGRLVGPYVTVIGGGYVAPLENDFDLTRGDPRFEGLMAYAHLDRIQRYFQALGFRGGASINNESQDVVATRVEGFDNSFYQPGNDLMLLGTGGVDDGEDADVIVHEYGHAVQDAQVRGWGNTNEGGAMGEGFGDFLAAAYYARASSFNDECVADWDATTYSKSNPRCLRRTDSSKKYPGDLANQVHDDGEMWSAFLWRLRARLGRTAVERSDNAIKLVLASHEFLTPSAEFGDGVAALRTAAKAMRKNTWLGAIDSAARQGGLPLK